MMFGELSKAVGKILQVTGFFLCQVRLGGHFKLT